MSADRPREGDPIYVRAAFIRYDAGDVRVRVRMAGGNEYVLTVPGADALAVFTLDDHRDTI